MTPAVVFETRPASADDRKRFLQPTPSGPTHSNPGVIKTEPRPPGRLRHIAGLDALRFVAALWVLIGHLGSFPLFDTIDTSNWIVWSLRGAYNNLFSGPAAVIVFFVISGFCIHFPYASGAPFSVAPFYTRRYVRIGIPMAVAILVSHAIGLNLAVFEDSILWSLVAELIYYTLYPFLRALKRRLNFDAILVTTFLLSFLVVLTAPSSGNYPSYGWQLNWLLGLPCWLLGVRLADQWGSSGRSIGAPDHSTIWNWRLGVWGLSVFCSILRFHSPLGYPWTLNLFAIAVYFWLDREIARGMQYKPWGVLERAGSISYSIYLSHMFALRLFATLASSAYLAKGVEWIVKLLLALLISYLFYVVVEQQAHRLARYLSRRLGPQPIADLERANRTS